MIAAIFDLDGTLLDGHVWMAVAAYHKTCRINRRWFYLYLSTHMPLWYLSRLHLMSGEQMRFIWARNLGWSLRGFDAARAGAMFAWIADAYVVPRLRPDVLACLREHQAHGHRVVLLSGAFEGLLQVVGERLGIDTVIGTRLRQRDGRYSGAPLPPVCQGPGKLQRLSEFLAGLAEQVDLDASYGYADSLTDRPVLERVGHPVAVYPEEGLAELARREGWPILGTTT